MSDYTDVVLALNPIFFGLLYDAHGSTVITDLSPNGNDGTYSGSAVFGLPSAIETDPASFSVGDVVGSIPVSVGSDLELPDNFTAIGFTYYDEALADTIHLWGRKGQFGLSNSVQAGINGGVTTSHVTLFDGVTETFYPLTDPVAPVAGNFYMITTVRNSTVHNLYTNDRLAATRSDLTVDIMSGAGGGLPWWIGRAQNTSAFPGLRTCSFILFDYALNAAQVTAIYEAAINATLLNGLSAIIPTGILDSTDDPDPINFPFRHNWSNDLIERISFQTSISQAISGPEEARQVRPKPRREIEIHQLLRDNSERRALRAKLWANQHAKWFVPILEDRETISSLLISSTEIPVSTLYKDYEIGSYVQIRQLNAFGQITQSETIEIEDFDDDSVTLVSGVENSYSGQVEVCPARRAYINVSSARGHTDAVEDLIITTRLLAEDEETIPNRITPFVVSVKYRDYEVFRESLWQTNDWSEQREFDLDRNLHAVDLESGIFELESDTPGNQEAFTQRIWIKGREQNASFLGWFYERAGALNYLWVPSKQEDFEIISVSADEITVEGTNYSDNYLLAEARRDLAFIYEDGSMIYRRVTDFAAGSTTEVLTLDADCPTLTNLRMVSLLKFCRLDADTLEIAKRTDDVWIYAWRFRELLESPAGEGVSSMSPSASMSGSVSPSASLSPSSSVSPSISPSLSPSPSLSVSPSSSQSPSASQSPSSSVSASVSPSGSSSLSVSPSSSISPSGSASPSSSESPSVSPSASVSPS